MKEFLQNLNPIRKVVWFIFALWVVRGWINHRIDNLEQKVQSYDAIKIETKLAQIQVDLERIKITLKQHTN